MEYLNPSFLVKKPNGGSCLVTAFADAVERYSKPQPALLPDVDSSLHLVAQLKQIIVTDLTSAFYQIPLARESMKYCGVATPFKGVCVYARSAMGMPSSETALEEVMRRLLGQLLQDDAAGDLYCGDNTPQELFQNWKKVLQALYKCDFRLSASKTIINPKSTTILGWIWSSGTLTASSHRVNTLASCPEPDTVGRMRSFIAAYKVLSRVIPRCSAYLAPLDDATAGSQSQEAIVWTVANISNGCHYCAALHQPAPQRQPSPSPLIDVSDLVYLHSDRNKSLARDRYLVVSVDPPFCNIKKFVGSP